MSIQGKECEIEIEFHSDRLAVLVGTVCTRSAWTDIETKEWTGKEEKRERKRERRVEVVEMPTIATKGLCGPLEGYQGLWVLYEIIIERDTRGGKEKEEGEGGGEVAKGPLTAHRSHWMM